VQFCYRVGMNYVSCSPYRVPIARLAAAQAAISGDKHIYMLIDRIRPVFVVVYHNANLQARGREGVVSNSTCTTSRM
jgi:hypothetical protein